VLHQDAAADRQPVHEPLIEILESLVGEPAFEAISTGHPERMGLAYGWSIEDFLARSRTRTPGGKPYANLCVGCNAFDEEMLRPLIDRARKRRRAARTAAE
jgi:hypothetical protein